MTLLTTRNTSTPGPAVDGDAVQLTGDKVRLEWKKQPDGWHVIAASAKGERGWIDLPAPSGLHTIVHLARNPALPLVEVNREGVAFPYYPGEVEPQTDGSLLFKQSLSIGKVESRWSIDPDFPTDVRVCIRITAARRGHYSLSSPTLAVFEPEQIQWGMVPGNWYGRDVQSNSELSPHYSQGIPNRSYQARECNTMTLCPLISAKSGVTLAVIPDPGTATDPWEKDTLTRGTWKVGLSTMDRYSQLTPVACHPVLGQSGPMSSIGETITFGFRYTIAADSWFSVYRHAVMDVYQFPELLKLQTSRESLSDRVGMLSKMLSNDQQSGWKVIDHHGVQIGANGTKTSDVGAMYMLARTIGDAALNHRLPFLRRYKLAQQQMTPGFFQHAATGEYPEEHGFVAERGNWIEPLFTTYYTMLDMGNMSLFDPSDTQIKDRIRLAAERLIQWQHDDGSFEVAYDSVSHKSSFPFLTDLRPTWYGLSVAARVLNDERYLAAARKGADWYIRNAVDQGHYLGACGDALNIWDFTTVFGSQALLDLYDQTRDETYKNAAIEVARVYATSIFTQPIATNTIKTIAGAERKDWEISQVGLSVEHIRGTAQSGPVLLSSHAGLFVRMYELTREQLFLDMARAAARGRHHFTDPDTGMAVYYWNAIDRVSQMTKLFPWHAEWQVGWITDYLVSEAHLRTNGQVHFPAGFPTPKVGSHVTYGFAPGTVFGQEASLWLGHRAVRCDNPNTEYLSAIGTDGSTLFVIAMNQFPQPQEVTITVDTTQRAAGCPLSWRTATSLAGEVVATDPAAGTARLRLQPWGVGVVALMLTNSTATHA